MSANQLDMSNTQIYQAVGVLGGLISIDGDEYSIVVDGHSYKINIKRKMKPLLRNGETAYLKAYPDFINGSLEFFVLHPVRPVVAAQLKLNLFSLKGCWEERNGSLFLAVYRNEMPGKTLGNFYSSVNLIPLDWQNTNPPVDGKYWEMMATLKGNGFVVSQILGLGEPPIKGDPTANMPIEIFAPAKVLEPSKTKAAIAKKKRLNSRKKKEAKVLVVVV